jgi:tRNA threonylcarbamoyladenosine biosynthesis protein TsaE
MDSLSFEVQSLDETNALGQRLGACLFPGAVVALIGSLGAGKTHLARAIAVGLDIADPAVVNSPTFVLIQEYVARLPIYHFDAYRLTSEADFADLGAHEYFASNGVCLVEWADKVPSVLPHERLEVRIAITGTESRRFDVIAVGERYQDMIRRLRLRDR